MPSCPPLPAAGTTLVAEDPVVAAAVRDFFAGRVTRALAALEQPADPARPRSAADRVLVVACTVEGRIARGELAAARYAVRDLDTATGDGLLGTVTEVAPATAAVAHHACGELAAALGHEEEALAHHQRTGVLLAGAAGGPHLLPWRGRAALVLIRLGRAREAVALAAEWERVATAAGSPVARAHALRVLAAVESGSQRTARLEEARALLPDPDRAARLAAQIDTDLATLLLLGAPTDSADARRAVRLLRAAEEYAGREDLRPLQGRVRALLARAGEAPRPHRREALATLTTTEQRVARLAADGLTNREIADSLTVTVKVVERHLSRVYRKLDIRSRRRLGDAFDLAV